ncbi:two-component sensor histidine kinase [Pseudoduganella sp. FT93W]|uniref:histidine kinase n=1 Tax=Duganella fentianensis TaxID=2692177 RepID=A0A845HZB1_9BURK|nr:two-component sensor histidine kinase [Duganella fentianensis]
MESGHTAAPAEARASFWRSLQTLSISRVVIALVLLVYLSFDRNGLRADSSYLNLQLCVVYLMVALGYALLAVYWQQRFRWQLLSQIAADLVIISLLFIVGGGLRSGLAILYLFPLAGAAILAPLLLSLFCTALVALFMLGESIWRVLMMESERPFLQAGLYGAAFFAAVLVVNRLAARLIGQEELAIQRGVEVNVQQAVNQLVMANVGDGILVADRAGHIYASNPAAQQMLGMLGAQQDFRLADSGALAPLAEAYAAWCEERSRSTAYVTIKPYADDALQQVTAAWSVRRDLSAHLKVRFAAVDTAGLGTERSVIFLQDVTGIENQAQQLKLASMGRLTASIAHEVRNPLSAIGHATALLGEDMTDGVQTRLLKIIGDNVSRVNRMVEDILQLSRKAQPHNEPLALQGFLTELVQEFTETHGLPADMLGLTLAEAAPVRFDALHLREVLLNLLNNAVRYASGSARSIRLDLRSLPSHALELHVQDDGPGIEPEVRAHLFEPFYTTSSKGTGLGLYLARELCLNNEARLDYEYRFDGQQDASGKPRSSGRFVITFAHPAPK